MKSLKSKCIFIIYLFTLSSCITQNKPENTYNFHDKRKVYCTPKSEAIFYEIGDLPCTKDFLIVNKNETLKIHFKTTNKDSEDPYERGYQELLRYKDNQLIEVIKLRRNDDAYWVEAPFVRLRKQKYFADLDNDGYLEFAIFPFHPGSAIWMTARIYSLKEKIEFWGTGRYQFEGDTFVQLGCPRCSKFRPHECKKCQ